jgi:hypothetical protein
MRRVVDMATIGAQGPTVMNAQLRRLRALAVHDSAAAAAHAWRLFGELGDQVGTDRAGTDAALTELFRAGKPASTLDGITDGMLVAPMVHPIADYLIRTVASVWLPWQGKRFDAISMQGDNRLSRSIGWPAKLIFPRCGLVPAIDGWTGFAFQTRVEFGALDPETRVLVLDYARLDENPKIVIRCVRDELVEIVPGAYLGRVLWRFKDSTRNIGWFALRDEVPSAARSTRG